MSESPPTGTESNPVFTDTVPISAGTAIVIGTAASAIVLAQSTIRAWRHVSLAQGRGLILARIPLLVLVLLLTSTIAAVGAFRLFRDDARAMGGLFPLLGVLAPFVFLARRPDSDSGAVQRPSRARLASWLTESAVNVILLSPGLALTALCVWGMVEAQSWDVLALSFSIAVAVITRSDPPLYYAWDGVGPLWQWGRILPCPCRMPSWCFVIGRVEDTEGGAEIAVDAMEVPLVDSRAMQGFLLNEDGEYSDRTLAREMRLKGVHEAMPHFYNYVETVWREIVHDLPRRAKGPDLDQTAASSYLLIVSLLKEALENDVRIGADVWLLLAILYHRLTDIASDYISQSNWGRATRKARMAVLASSLWSAMSGRERGKVLDLDDDLVAELENARLAANENSDDEEIATSRIENGKASGGDAVARGNSPMEGETEGDLIEVSQSNVASQEEEDDGGEVDDDTEHYTLQMFQAFQRAESPPETTDVADWIAWILQALEDLYQAAISVSAQESNTVGKKQIAAMSNTFIEWIGEDNCAVLASQIRQTLQGVERTEAEDDVQMDDADANKPVSTEARLPVQETARTPIREARKKVATDETWTYIMLVMANEYITESVSGNSEVYFETAGVDVSEGEMNGRLKAQNMARKIVLAQVALWGYVALGQTATALLTRG